ncbi:MAG: hypothetical protein ACREIO_06395, partial [Nitrospiraceae bacterium]
MGLDPRLVAEFRGRLNRSRETNQEAWNLSRRLVEPSNLQATLKRLADAIRASSFPPSVRDALLGGLRDGSADRMQALPGDALRQLTGLSPTKAVRALCVLFGLTKGDDLPASDSTFTPAQIEQFVRGRDNPFDLLLAAEAASLLDLGAGDLSFAAELADLYLPRFRQPDKDLTLHCVERLRPGSTLGGRLHVDQDRLERLRHFPSPRLHFRFWGNQDMLELETVKGLRPCYTVVTCHGPATPTFAYEPTRVSRSIIDAHLRKTKGQFRAVRVEGEEALEVLHAGRALLFPPWKFEVRGPLALLDLLSKRGQLGVLSAVDSEVFWEILSQLLEDARLRPPDVILTPSIIAEVFGAVHARLAALPVGGSVVLSDVTDLRQDIPRVLSEPAGQPRHYHFRYVEVRRGAVFPGLPSSQTARLFKDM